MKTPTSVDAGKLKTALMRRKGSADPYLEEDEDGQRRVVLGRPVHADATHVRPREPARIAGTLPTAHASPPGGWAKQLGMDLPREGGMRLNSGRSRNVEDHRPRGIGAAIRRLFP